MSTKAIEEPTSAVNLVLQNKERFEKILPKHMDIEKFMSLIGTQLREHPEWEKIDSISLIGSLLHCIYLGLEPGSHHNFIYLIGYAERNEGKITRTVIKPMIGYMGMIEVMKNAGAFKKIFAESVYHHDQFKIWNDLEGDCQHMIHEHNIEGNRSGQPKDIRGAYAVIVLKDGTKSMAWLSREEIERDHLKSKNPIWRTNFTEMCKKTAIRRLYKTQVKSKLLSEAIAREENEEFDYGKLAEEMVGKLAKGKLSLRESLETEAPLEA